MDTGGMLTYALFIATDPHPVSESDWTHLDDVFERARLSSGGTSVEVRASEGGGDDPEDFTIDVARFVNGRRLETRAEGSQTIHYLSDGDVIGTAQHADGRWLLSREPGGQSADGAEIAFVPDAGHTREDVEHRLRKVVEDWLS